MQRQISLAEFKQLLAALENSGIAIRIRLTGESWGDFSQVLLLSENAMILQDGKRRIITNLKNVREFEIDSPHSPYEANSPYSIEA